MRFARQLQLDGIVQLIACLGLHEAGIGRTDQRAEFRRGQAELALAVGVEKQQGPTGFIQPLETQHAEPGWHGQLRYYLGRHSLGDIGLAFHGRLASRELIAHSRHLFQHVGQGCIMQFGLTSNSIKCRLFRGYRQGGLFLQCESSMSVGKPGGGAYPGSHVWDYFNGISTSLINSLPSRPK
ncbi:hypothetical protein D3C76_598920 [compost metagenome]